MHHTADSRLPVLPCTRTHGEFDDRLDLSLSSGDDVEGACASAPLPRCVCSINSTVWVVVHMERATTVMLMLIGFWFMFHVDKHVEELV